MQCKVFKKGNEDNEDKILKRNVSNEASKCT